MKTKLLTLLTLLCITLSFAQTFTDNGLNYNVISTNPNEVELTDGTPASTDLVIPEIVNNGIDDFTVTSVGDQAFQQSGLTSVTFPTTITAIGEQAFQQNQLVNLDLPQDLLSLGLQAFQGNGLVDIIFPDGLPAIGEAVFSGNQLTSLNIPASVTSIEAIAFRNNPLTTLTLSEGLLTIGDEAFRINELTSLTLPSTLTSLGARALETNNLTLVESLAVIPPSITTGTDDSFGNNRNDITLFLPSGNEQAYIDADWTGFAGINELTAPYTEDFESFTTSGSAFVAENGWTATGGDYFWEAAPGTDTGSDDTGPDPSITTGNYFYTEASNGSNGDITDLVSPLVDLTNLTAPALTFNYHMFGVAIGTLDILVNGTDNVLSLSGEQQTSSTAGWEFAIIDLSAYAGQTISVTFRGTRGNSFEGDIAIDNVAFDELPTCLPTSDLAANNITDLQADLSWTENGTATLWDIELVDITAGETATGTPTSAGLNNPSFSATSLTQDNDYAFFVRADCSGDISIWSGPFPFKTLETCPRPSNLSASNITQTSLDLGWTENGTATLYNIELLDITAGDIVTGSPTETGVSNPFTINNLIADNDYQFYVQADCDTDGVSAWVGPFSFSTSPAPPECGNVFVDTGGSSGNYSNGENITYTICPDNPGDVVYVDFSLFSTENNGANGCFDGLTIHDGADNTASTINPPGGGTIWCWDRNDSPPIGTGDLQGMTLISTDASGCLTFVFTSDGSVQRPGWEAAVTCGPPITCTPAEGTAVLGATDCDGTDTFFIDVDITNLGDATTVTIANDAGVTATDVTATGVVAIGPFASGSDVNITLEHDAESFCDADLGNVSFICSDNCDTAIALTIPEASTCPANIVTSTSGATEGADELTSCDNGDNLGIWYSFTAPTSGQMEFTSGAGSPGIVIYEGACDALTEVAGTCFNNASGSIVGLTPGNPYFAMIWTDTAQTNIEFCLFSLTCAAAEATTTIVEDCDNNQFTIDVDVTNLGSSTTLTISNDAGVTATDITATGIVNIGPFTVGTVVTITLEHESDTACDLVLPVTTFLCPPPNDECTTAELITQETDIVDVANATANAGILSGATDSGLAAEACGGFTGNANDDVWYTFEALTTDVNITIDATFDSVVQLYSGTCGALTVIDCADSNFGTGVEEITATGLTVGETYFTRIYQFNTDSTAGETFDLSIWSPSTLDINELEIENAFTYYPNPVKNTLTLNAKQNIDTVVLYNMLGQDVLKAQPNSLNSQLDMSHLQNGTYFVKVTVNSITETIRVIKQ